MARDTRILGLHWHGWAALLIFVPTSAALSVYLSREPASPPTPPAPRASPTWGASAGQVPPGDARLAWPPRSVPVVREPPGTAVRGAPDKPLKPVDDESGDGGTFLPVAGQYDAGSAASSRRERKSRQTVPQSAFTGRSAGDVADGAGATAAPDPVADSAGADPGPVVTGIPIVGGAVFVGGAGTAVNPGEAVAPPEASQGANGTSVGPATSPAPRSRASAVPDPENEAPDPRTVPRGGGGDDGSGSDPGDAAPPFETLSGEGPPPPPRL